MPNYSKNEVIFVQYPFSDLSATKVRLAIRQCSHPSQDNLIVPLTSRITSLLPAEFLLTEWQAVRLNVQTAVKRGIFTIHRIK
jgi:mRNA interferase MazF